MIDDTDEEGAEREPPKQSSLDGEFRCEDWSRSLAFLIVGSGGDGADRQARGSSSRRKSVRGRARAPVGHRQPRADQVPSEKNLSDPNDPVNREDAALDRKIKSICRGC